MSIQATLGRLGLQEYYQRLVEYGIDTWDHLVVISETDMATLGIKLGHRRKLQREIASSLGYPPQRPLNDTVPVAAERRKNHSKEDGAIPSTRLKRKGRRRGLQYFYDPSRPATGFIAYARFLRQDSTISNLSYSEFSKTDRERWTLLSADVKDIWITSVAGQYNQTEAHQVRYSCFESWRPKDNPGQEEVQVSCNGFVPENDRPNSRNALPLSACDASATRNPPSSFHITLQAGNEFWKASPTLVC
jgi:hypothetical protein